MNAFLSRWLRGRRRPVAPPVPVTPTPSPSDDDAMPSITHHRADYRGIRQMHLLRPNECFELALGAWVTVIRFAHITGEWQLAGTDAVASGPPPAYGGQGFLCVGHYMPVGQQLSAEDATALAAGIRRALVEMPRGPECRDGGGVRTHQVRDPRLHENANSSGAEIVVWQLVVDLHIDRGDGDRLADFLERGACTIHYGPPTHVLAAEEAEKRRRERRVPFEQEQERLLSALQSGMLAPELAGPRLEAVRARLAAFDEEEAARVGALT